MTVGAFLVIAMVVTPGATAYLLTDRFGRALRAGRRHRRGLRPRRRLCQLLPRRRHRRHHRLLQTLVFLTAFVFAPKHGMLAARRRGREALR